MRAPVLVVVVLTAGCSAGPATGTLAPATPAPVTTTARGSWLERDYLDALRAAQVPVSRTGESEISIGRGVCAEVAKGMDPEALADDLLRSVPGWSSDNVTALIRTALTMLC